MFRPQDLHITHVYVLGVDCSLLSLTHPHITTLPLQDDLRCIHRDIQLKREWRRIKYRVPAEVISLMLTSPEFELCSPQWPAKFGRTHVARLVQS